MTGLMNDGEGAPDQDVWAAWYMAYPATAILIALAYVICFIVGVVSIAYGVTDPAVFWTVAMAGLKYGSAATGIIGSIWALHDYLG